MKKLASLLLAGVISTSNISCSKDSIGSIIDYIANDRQTYELADMVNNNYNDEKKEHNNDGKRRTNFNWNFYSMNQIPPNNKKGVKLVDKKNYHFAKGVPNAIYYLTSDTALVCIRKYEQNFNGNINTFEYTTERYVYDCDSSSWYQLTDFSGLATEFCTGGSNCINNERVISRNKKGSLGRQFDNGYLWLNRQYNSLMKSWKLK